MGCNGFLHCLGKVVPQMPAVSDFDRLRRPSTGCFGKCAGAVTADYLGSGMCSQPFGDSAGCAIGENIDRTVSVHVDQNSPVPMPHSERAKSSMHSSVTTPVEGRVTLVCLVGGVGSVLVF